MNNIDKLRAADARIATLAAQLAEANHEVDLLRADLDSMRLRLTHMEDYELPRLNKQADDAVNLLHRSNDREMAAEARIKELEAQL